MQAPTTAKPEPRDRRPWKRLVSCTEEPVLSAGKRSECPAAGPASPASLVNPPGRDLKVLCLQPAFHSLAFVHSPTDGRRHSEAAVSPLTAAAAFSREKSPEGSQDERALKSLFFCEFDVSPFPTGLVPINVNSSCPAVSSGKGDGQGHRREGWPSGS